MAELWAQIDTLTPEEIHRRFMGIHPLADGNARTGLIILVWLTASWHDPLGPATADSEAAEAGFPS